MCTINETIGSNLVVPTNDDKLYKALRRYLTKGVGYETLLPLLLMPKSEGCTDQGKRQDNDDTGSNTPSAESVVIISTPHSLLGARRIAELHPSIRASHQLPPSTSTGTTTSSSTVVAIDSVAVDLAVPTLHDQALDGSQPKGDTYDRVCFHVPLHASKKQLTMLPDEAVDLLLHQAKVASCKDIIEHLPPKQRRAATGATKGSNLNHTTPHPLLQEENFTSAPLAVAVPGYATHDSALESWMELISKEDIDCATALLFPRSAAAVMASLLTPSPTPNNHKLPPPLLQRTKEECQKLMKESQRLLLDVERGSHLDPLIVIVGVSSQEGYEIASLQLSKSLENYPFFEEYRYHHTRCALFPHSALNNEQDKHRIISTELKSLLQDLAITLPGRKPCAILVYSDCLEYTHKLEGLVRQTWNEQTPMDSQATTAAPLIVSCKENAIAFGTVLLAAAKCDRLDSRPVQITSVSHTSVGLRFSYVDCDRQNNSNEDNVKVIFDFDRRLPAGPYVLEFTATECAAKREGFDASDLQKLEGKKGIPKREEAALNFTVQVVQRQDRFSNWVPVDDIMYPLRMEKYDSADDSSTKDDQSKKENSTFVACESARFEIRMKSEGTLISTLANDGYVLCPIDFGPEQQRDVSSFFFCVFCPVFTEYLLFKLNNLHGRLCCNITVDGFFSFCSLEASWLSPIGKIMSFSEIRNVCLHTTNVQFQTHSMTVTRIMPDI